MSETPGRADAFGRSAPRSGPSARTTAEHCDSGRREGGRPRTLK